MSLVTRRLRSLLIALAVLALSATAVLAGRSALATTHDSVASQQGGDQQAEESEASETELSDAPEVDPSDATDTADQTDLGSTDATAGVHPDNHGKLVSEAAQSATLDGFANHGAYVKTIAQANAGHVGAAAAARHAKHAKAN